MLYLFVGLDLYIGLLLLFVLVFVLFYEVINGFYDIVNVVVMVIYICVMCLQFVVVMVVFFNFFGVLLGGFSVVYVIVYMLLIDLLFNMGFVYGFVMVFFMLLVVIIWNFGIWYFGFLVFSFYILIGVIIGIGLINVLMIGIFVVDVLNILKVIGIFVLFIILLIVGLVIVGGLIFLLCCYWSGIKKCVCIYLMFVECEKKDGKKKLLFWICIVLILFVIGVLFFYGVNDGQKGIGLVMLVLIGVVLVGFVVNMNVFGYEIICICDVVNNVEIFFQQCFELLKKVIGVDQLVFFLDINIVVNGEFYCYLVNIINVFDCVKIMLIGVENYELLKLEQCGQLCCIMFCIFDIIDKVVKLLDVSVDDQCLLKKLKIDMLSIIEYVLIWIIMVVVLVLGIGIMIGWCCVVIIIGEKIGKKGMIYVQGMLVQMIVVVFIGLVSYIGMLVFIIYVFFFLVVGMMLVDGGGLQKKMVISILMVWVLILLVVIIFLGVFYWFFLKLI